MESSKQVVEVGFDKEILKSSLLELAGVIAVTEIKNKIWLIEAQGDKDIRPILFDFAVNNNLTVLSLQKQENNLEEVFRHLTKG